MKKGSKHDCNPSFFGVADGARTHDNRNHNSSTQTNAGAGYSPARGKFYNSFHYVFITFLQVSFP